MGKPATLGFGPLIRAATQALVAEIHLCLDSQAHRLAVARGPKNEAPTLRPEDYGGDGWRRFLGAEMQALGDELAALLGPRLWPDAIEAARNAALEAFVADRPGVANASRGPDARGAER